MTPMPVDWPSVQRDVNATLQQWADTCWQVRQQQAHLLAALDALAHNWCDREQQYRHVRPHDEVTADTLRSCAKELAAVLATHRGADAP